MRKTEQLKAEFLCISSVLHYEQPVVRSLKSADSVMKRLPDMQTNTILYLFAVFLHYVNASFQCYSKVITSDDGLMMSSIKWLCPVKQIFITCAGEEKLKDKHFFHCHT